MDWSAHSMFTKILIANRGDNRSAAEVAAKPNRLACEASGDRAAESPDV